MDTDNSETEEQVCSFVFLCICKANARLKRLKLKTKHYIKTLHIARFLGIKNKFSHKTGDFFMKSALPIYTGNGE